MTEAFTSQCFSECSEFTSTTIDLQETAAFKFQKGQYKLVVALTGQRLNGAELV